MSKTARPSKIVPRPGVGEPDPKAQRKGNYENRSLLDLAHRLQECQLRLPGVCQGYAPGGCEPAHSNQARHGKGKSIKAHDHFHAAACHACHTELDQGLRFSKEEKAEFWQTGFERTLTEYFKRGWLDVTPAGKRG